MYFLKEGKARERNKSYHVFIVIFTFLFVLELVSGLFPSKLWHIWSLHQNVSQGTLRHGKELRSHFIHSIYLLTSIRTRVFSSIVVSSNLRVCIDKTRNVWLWLQHEGYTQHPEGTHVPGPDYRFLIPRSSNLEDIKGRGSCRISRRSGLFGILSEIFVKYTRRETNDFWRDCVVWGSIGLEWFNVHLIDFDFASWKDLFWKKDLIRMSASVC